MEDIMASPQSDLDNFIAFLFDGLEGYAYLAAKTPAPDADGPKNIKTDWMQEFFAYPSESDKLKGVIRAVAPNYEIYLAPVLYSSPVAKRENFKGSNVVWADFDGNAPDWQDTHGRPSLIVQSSTSSNQHAYWRLNSPITDVTTLDDLNRRITYNMGADPGGWDATQVLRPPGTVNHKYADKPEVSIYDFSGVSYEDAIFNDLAPAPEQVESEWKLASLPAVQDVILRYAFSPDLVLLLGKEKAEVKDRSASLMNLAYGCCQLGMSDAEVFVVLRLADDRWEKFKGRADREKRLAHIISVARTKYPEQLAQSEAEAAEDAFSIAFDYLSFLNAEISVDWLIEPMLMERGSMILVGPSGVGKTQFSLQVMIHLALGKDFLHYRIAEPKKVLFASLEMDHGSLQIFLRAMNTVLSDAERDLLAENFVIIPHGEPWALNTTVGQSFLVQFLEAVQPDVLFVDSIGSAIRGNISADENVQPLLDFNDAIKKKYNLSVWYIHHMRKAQQGSGGSTTQDDIYGNQYILNRSTSAYALLFGKNGNLKLRNFKNRLAPKEDDHLLARIDNLNFEPVTKEVDAMLGHINSGKDKPSDSDETAPGGFTL